MEERIMKKGIGIGIMALAALSASQAFALFDGTTTASIRQDMQTSNVARIEGVLECKMSAVNDGSACDLKLIDVRNNRAYGLVNGNGVAMRMFQSGVRSVSIEGNVNADAGIIEIADIKAL